MFGRSNQLIRSTKDVGDDTRVFNGVDVKFNVRSAKGVTFSGGTSTGKVENDWCDIRAAVPETSCPAQSVLPQSSRRCRRRSAAWSTYTIPRIDVLLSGVIGPVILKDKPNNGAPTRSAVAARQLHADRDGPTRRLAAQIGRPLTTAVRSRSTWSRRARSTATHPAAGHRCKKILRFGGQRLTVGVDIYNLMNNNMMLFYNRRSFRTSPGWLRRTRT